MTQTTNCPNCDAVLPANAPAGICPKCLLAAGLESDSKSFDPTIDSPTANRFQPPSAAELAGIFPQIEVIELLGYGGMGAVYKARQARLDRFVALKILRVGPTNDSDFAERFSREAKMLARLTHSKIVSVYDFGEVEMQIESAGEPRLLYYFIMEYVEGTNLRQLMQSGELKPDQAIAIVPEICEALQYAHDHGVVHRDIKPENILVDLQGHVKIADFGLAKLANRSAEDYSLTHAQQVMGTVRYMAPEQMEASSSVDHRADIYSLGVVFYEMLTGDLPTGNFDPPSRKVQLDVRLDEVVLRSLAREPDRRYQHASEIKADVETVSNSRQVRQTSNNSLPAAITDIDEQQRAAEIAEVPPDWLCLPVVALFIIAWSTVGVLWNLRLPGLVVSMGVMAGAVYLVLRMKLRYLPKLKRELQRVPRWSRALALVNGLALVSIGILLIISVQIRLLNNLFMTRQLVERSYPISTPDATDILGSTTSHRRLPRHCGSLQRYMSCTLLTW